LNEINAPVARRRRLIKALAAAGLLTNGGIMGFMQRALANGTNPLPPGLHRLKGTVTVNGAAARAGQLVKPGDTLVTGKDGEALFVMEQDAFLQRGDTTVSFGKTTTDFMRVATGRILSVFGKGERQIKFATAVIGIRGTACYIETGEAQRNVGVTEGNPFSGTGGTAQERAYFCLCYGEAEITPTAAPEERETIRTSHHDHPLYISNDMKMPSMMVSAPVINHTDAELIMLENLVGRLPPFYGQPDIEPY
jgi:hypothetical protein